MGSTVEVGQTAVEEYLAHFGKKGMKWGVRNEKKAAKKLAKADEKWEKKALSRDTVIKIYNSAATAANKDLPGINAKYKGKDLLADPKTRLAYDTEVVKNFDKHVKVAAKAEGLNPSGTKGLSVTINPISGEMYAYVGTELAHANLNGGAKMTLTRNDQGYITNISFPENFGSNLMHDMVGVAIDDILEHAGVKGMRWGVRRTQRQLDRAAGRTSTKKEDVSELSDADLRAKLNRLQMEKQYRELTKGPPSKAEAGKKFLASVMQDIAKQTLVNVGKSHTNNFTKGFLAGAKKGKGVPTLPPVQGPLRPPIR